MIVPDICYKSACPIQVTSQWLEYNTVPNILFPTCIYQNFARLIIMIYPIFIGCSPSKGKLSQNYC